MHSEDTKENVLQKPSTTGARKKWFLGHFDEITEFNTSSSTPVQATYNFWGKLSTMFPETNYCVL